MPRLTQDTGTCAEDLEKSDCEAAAKVILEQFGAGNGKVQDTPTGVSMAPPGCYHSAEDKLVYYNGNPSTGECSAATRCLCKKVSAQGAQDMSLLAQDPSNEILPRCEIDPLFGSEMWSRPCSKFPNMKDCIDFMGNPACLCNEGFEYVGNPVTGGCKPMVQMRDGGNPHCTRKLFKSEVGSWFKKPCTQYANTLDCDDGNGAHSCECAEGFSHNWKYQCVAEWR
jgi:hypothetical protein